MGNGRCMIHGGGNGKIFTAPNAVVVRSDNSPLDRQSVLPTCSEARNDRGRIPFQPRSVRLVTVRESVTGCGKVGAEGRVGAKTGRVRTAPQIRPSTSGSGSIQGRLQR